MWLWTVDVFAVPALLATVSATLSLNACHFDASEKFSGSIVRRGQPEEIAAVIKSTDPDHRVRRILTTRKEQRRVRCLIRKVCVPLPSATTTQTVGASAEQHLENARAKRRSKFRHDDESQRVILASKRGGTTEGQILRAGGNESHHGLPIQNARDHRGSVRRSGVVSVAAFIGPRRDHAT